MTSTDNVHAPIIEPEKGPGKLLLFHKLIQIVDDYPGDHLSELSVPLSIRDSVAIFSLDHGEDRLNFLPLVVIVVVQFTGWPLCQPTEILVAGVTAEVKVMNGLGQLIITRVETQGDQTLSGSSCGAEWCSDPERLEQRVSGAKLLWLLATSSRI